MISVFLREQCRYTFEQLNKLLEGSCVNVREILKPLKYKGIVKTVKKTSEQVDLSDLTDDEIVMEDTPGNVFYVFTYVGIIAIKDVILKCYPKYLKKALMPTQELKLALRAIEKYSLKSQKVNLYDELGDKTTVNRLAIMAFLLKDYFDYGLYSDSKDIVEENGRGEILWDRTVNNTYALLSNDEPYYPLLYTKRRIVDEQDFFRRMHACILYKIFREFESAAIIELFDITDIPPVDEELSDLGDDDYLLYRLEREVDTQFNTRKKQLLQAMATYIANKDVAYDGNDSVNMYGTNRFNLVWENACNDVLSDQRYSSMGVLDLPQNLDKNYSMVETLLSVVEKPRWYGRRNNESFFCKIADKTLVPDFLAVRRVEGKYSFIILDAKHYNLQLEEEKPLSGQPGIESVTKQYLYELAYRDFIKRNHIEAISNCFLFPTEENSLQVKGYVELNFLHGLKLQNISIRLLPASKVFACYISGQKIPIEDLRLDFGIADYE